MLARLVDQSPETLMKICYQLGLDVTPTKVENVNNRLLKMVVRYLSSAEVESSSDSGEATFLLVKTIIDEIEHESATQQSKAFENVLSDYDDYLGVSPPAPGTKPKMERKSAATNHTFVTPPVQAQPTFSLHKLKEFKISGSIGSPGQKDKLTYSSLSYQIQQGKRMGYTEEEICSAVIKAITPGISLRVYLENKSDLDLSSLLAVMRSHYKEKDSTSVFTEMSNAAQLPTETAHEFAIRLMSLRQRVLLLSREEDCPYDLRLVKKRFLYALSTGLKSSGIRHNLQEQLKDMYISDENLLADITDAMTLEADYTEKLSRKKATVTVQAVQKTSEKEKKQKSNELSEQIRELTVKVAELSSVRHDIEQLKTAVSQMHESESENRNRKDRITSRLPEYMPDCCPRCEADDTEYCSHCFECGSSKHIRSECPLIYRRSNEKN